MNYRSAALMLIFVGVVSAQDFPGPHCICVPDTKKVTKTTYECKCSEYCSPRWALGDWWFGRKPQCGECGTLRTRKTLVKFTTTKGETTTKCIPAVLPDASTSKK